MMQDLVLDIRDLHVRFPGLARTVKAVRGASLCVRRGEIMGLVGESGSGKSITSLACLGLVPSPGEVTGSISVAGRQIVGESDRNLSAMRGRVAAMIFQNPGTALNPFFTVERQLLDVIQYHLSLSKTAARQAAIDALHAVRIPDPELALKKYPHQMSGGQLQRVMIAMAIACKPQLLIADEPTTALDVTVQAQVIVLLRELARETGLTILFITHDLGVVASLCDRVSVMYAGQVVETGTAEEIFDAPGHPYTQKLMDTVPSLGRGKAKLNYIAGQVPDMAFPPQGCAFHARCSKAMDACRRAQPEVHNQSETHSVNCHLLERENVG